MLGGTGKRLQGGQGKLGVMEIVITLIATEEASLCVHASKLISCTFQSRLV